VLGAELLFIVRTLAGVSSVLARLGARANWRRRLEQVAEEARVEREEPFAPSIERQVPPRAGGPVSIHREAAPAIDPSPEPTFSAIARSRDEIAHSPPPAPPVVRSAVRAPPPPLKPPEELWDVVLIAPGTSPIALIRELRELMGLDLRDIESILDSPPETLRRAVSRADAETWKQRLESVGAQLEVRRA
jgi:large subunit ribosomal protein L7/L12